MELRTTEADVQDAGTFLSMLFSDLEQILAELDSLDQDMKRQEKRINKLEERIELLAGNID